MQSKTTNLAALFIDQFERKTPAVPPVDPLAHDGKVAVADDTSDIKAHFHHHGHFNHQLIGRGHLRTRVFRRRIFRRLATVIKLLVDVASRQRRVPRTGRHHNVARSAVRSGTNVR